MVSKEKDQRLLPVDRAKEKLPLMMSRKRSNRRRQHHAFPTSEVAPDKHLKSQANPEIVDTAKGAGELPSGEKKVYNSMKTPDRI